MACPVRLLHATGTRVTLRSAHADPPAATVPPMADPWRRALPSLLFPTALVVLAVVLGGCGSSESARSCVTSGDAEVCAWRDATVRLSTDGLQPGSPFAYGVTVDDGTALMASPADLTVGDDGRVPGAISLLSATGGRVTIDVTAVAADGSPMADRLVVE